MRHRQTWEWVNFHSSGTWPSLIERLKTELHQTGSDAGDSDFEHSWKVVTVLSTCQCMALSRSGTMVVLPETSVGMDDFFSTNELHCSPKGS